MYALYAITVIVCYKSRLKKHFLKKNKKLFFLTAYVQIQR